MIYSAFIIQHAFKGLVRRTLGTWLFCDFILFDYLLFLSGFCFVCCQFLCCVHVIVCFLAGFCVCKSPRASANWLGDKCICQSFNLRTAPLPAPHFGVQVLVLWSLSSHAFLLGETPIVFIDFVSADPLFPYHPIPMC